MSKDPTFKILSEEPTRSAAFENYRKAWDSRSVTLNPDNYPIHLDIETVATCDLKCGSNQKDPNGFCQVWTHEHVRKLGFGEGVYKRGMIEPRKFFELVDSAKKAGVMSVKLNYRGEPSLHPEIEDFVRYCSLVGFSDIMMNTNGNGGARKDLELFIKLVKAGITSLNFSVDACNQETYTKQRVGGDWNTLLNSVRSAVLARDMGFGNQDLCIRASAVRTALNKDDIDSNRLQNFWQDRVGVDWVSVSECYFPAGSCHEWVAVDWEQVEPKDYVCSDPFRRMVVTWDLKHSLPCCQGFTLEVDGGELFKYTSGDWTIENSWLSENFEELREHHRNGTWDQVPMCVACPLTKKVKRYEV